MTEPQHRPAPRVDAAAQPRSGSALDRRVLRELPAVYAISFAVVGSIVPYLALEFREWGISGVTLAVAMGALPLGRLLAGPLWALIADRYQAAGPVLRVGSVLGMLGAAVLAAASVTGHRLPAVAVIGAMFLFAVGRAPMGPVVDTVALQALRGDRMAYGKLRLWGSVGFLVATMGTGWAREALRWSPLLIGVVACVGLVGVVFTLPRTDRLKSVPILPALRRLLADGVIRWVVIAAALHFAAHIGSTTFLSVHMDALGLSTSWSGLTLAVGVMVEVFVLNRSRWLFTRISPERVFLVAVAVSVPRWLLTAVVVDPYALVALQMLHGVTFGAFWVAGVQVVARRAPPEVANSGQALFGAAVGGVGALLGMVGGSLIIDLQPTAWLFWWGAVAAALAVLCTVIAFRHLRAMIPS